jgi:hypothetical protein
MIYALTIQDTFFLFSTTTSPLHGELKVREGLNTFGTLLIGLMCYEGFVIGLIDLICDNKKVNFINSYVLK